MWSTDETTVWIKPDVDSFEDGEWIVCFPWDRNAELDRTKVPIGTPFSIKDGAPLLHATQLKPVWYWSSITVSSLPVTHRTCNKSFQNHHNQSMLEAVTKNYDAHAFLSTADCTASFTNWALMALKKRDLPSNEWAQKNMWRTHLHFI